MRNIKCAMEIIVESCQENFMQSGLDLVTLNL